MADRSSAEELLTLCERGRADGLDFPTIWNLILKKHPLVNGLPGHKIKDGEVLIVVRLLNGRELLSSIRGFSLS